MFLILLDEVGYIPNLFILCVLYCVNIFLNYKL